MATPTTGTITSTPNDANATTQTIDFIENLKVALDDAKNTLATRQARLKNATASKDSLSEQFLSTQTAATLAKNNLEEAEKAQQQINIISDFFAERVGVTSQMVGVATYTATTMYEATEFMGKEGLERIDNILNLVLEYNKTDKNADTQWTPSFITTVQASSAKARTALNAAVKATEDSFTTLVSSLQIDYRTKDYYQRCLSYQKMMASLVERLTSEYVLLQIRSDQVDQQLQEVEMNLTTLNAAVDESSFEVAQLQAEYTAAQKGASYTGTKPAHASS
ncbi:MAG: hypothetical protein AAFV95_00195 [Bacteroidota bacterium]